MTTKNGLIDLRNIGKGDLDFPYVLLLTDDIEADELTAMRLSGDLTFVQSGVSGLREFDLQRPVLCRSGLDDGEPLVGRVSISTHRQDVDVTMPDPAHL